MQPIQSYNTQCPANVMWITAIMYCLENKEKKSACVQCRHSSAPNGFDPQLDVSTHWKSRYEGQTVLETQGQATN